MKAPLIKLTLFFLSIGLSNAALAQSANGNTIFGDYAGAGLNGASGSYNVLLGRNAGNKLTTGSYNAIIGQEAGTQLTGEAGNVMLGDGAGNKVLGSNNTLLGRWTGLNMTNGTQNVMIGFGAGINQTAGSYNTYIGPFAGPSAAQGNLQYATAIGAFAKPIMNNTIVLGGTIDANNQPLSINVGVGTSTPSAKLDVNGNLRVGAGTFSSIYSGNTDGGYPANVINELGTSQLSIGANWTGGLTDLSLVNSNVGNTSGGGFSFWQMTGPQAKRQLVYFQGNGNVGIGALTPEARLHVDGSIRQSGVGEFNVDLAGNSTVGSRLKITEGGNVGIGNVSPPFKLSVNGEIYAKGNMYLYANEGELSSGTAVLQARNLALSVANVPTDVNLQLRTQQQGQIVEAIHIKANGNTGVGTSTPSAKLDVNGNLRVGAGTFSSIYSGNTDGGYPANVINELGTSQLSIGANWTGGLTDLSLVNSNVGNTSGGGFSFWQMTGPQAKRQLVYFQGNGNVGIGTINPAARLDVAGDIRSSSNTTILGAVGLGTEVQTGYRLAVEGKIGAREVEVRANGWADFVFTENYPLRSLAEVEQFIGQHRHLPDIPSEAEVTSKGIALGAMNTKLLQKIEELTLYLIQQQKQINDLTKQLTKSER